MGQNKKDYLQQLKLKKLIFNGKHLFFLMLHQD